MKRIGMVIALMLFSFSLTVLYHGMRGVLTLGGFVASGGPYQITQPAPGWILLVPGSVILMVASILTASFIMTSGFDGPNLMAFSWPALFGALGWNFLDFGLGFGEGHQLVWAWLLCAFLFFLMGMVPLLFMIRRYLAKYRGKIVTDTAYPWVSSLLVQVLMVGLSVYGGRLLFRTLSQ